MAFNSKINSVKITDRRGGIEKILVFKVSARQELIPGKMNIVRITDGEAETIQELVVFSIKNFVDLCIEVKSSREDKMNFEI